MHWLFDRPTPDEANHWLAIVSLVVFALGVVAAGYLSTRPDKPPFRSKYTHGFVTRVCTILGWISGIGLFFGIIRLLQIDPATLGRGIWILLSWIALIAASVWLVLQAPADRTIRAENDARLTARSAAKPKTGTKARSRA